jgi:hypothetical protein
MKSKKKVIQKAIAYYFKTHNNRFYGHFLFNFVVEYTGMMVYPDTVLRYMREMREEGLINYETISRKKSLYEIKKTDFKFIEEFLNETRGWYF